MPPSQEELALYTEGKTLQNKLDLQLPEYVRTESLCTPQYPKIKKRAAPKYQDVCDKCHEALLSNLNQLKSNMQANPVIDSDA